MLQERPLTFMQLYATIQSERAKKGQGGNKYLDIDIYNEKREKTLKIKILPKAKKPKNRR